MCIDLGLWPSCSGEFYVTVNVTDVNGSLLFGFAYSATASGAHDLTADYRSGHFQQNTSRLRKNKKNKKK